MRQSPTHGEHASRWAPGRWRWRDHRGQGRRPAATSLHWRDAWGWKRKAIYQRGTFTLALGGGLRTGRLEEELHSASSISFTHAKISAAELDQDGARRIATQRGRCGFAATLRSWRSR